jgi:hypothetical protein
MIIPSKHSGYQVGIRLYPGGGSGGGSGGTSALGTGDSGGGLFTGYGGYGGGVGNTTYTPPTPAWGTTEQSKANYYNQQLGAGQNDAQIRANVDATLGGSQSDANWGRLVQTAGTSSPTGRPLPGSAQFFQPVYNGQSPNYNTGNSMGVSQYGQQMQTPFTPQPFNPYSSSSGSYSGGGGGGYSGGGGGGGYSSMGGGQMQNSIAQPQTSIFGGQMQGGGYGQYGSNNPFSPYSNSFLNLDPNLNQGTQADKANAYRSAIQNGFGDQQIYNQATGLFGQQSPQAWGYLQGSAMGMTPGLGQGTQQDKVGFYQGARNQGFNDQTIRNAANQMIGNQSQSDWSYLQNQAGYGGGSGGYGNQYMPQMQTPFSYPQQSYQPQMPTPFSYPQQSYQPAQQMQTPFSYPQQSYQPSYQPVQQPYYGGMGGNNFIPDAPLPEGMVGTMGGSGYDPVTGRMDLGTAGGSGQYTPAPPRSSGPRQAIVGRSSQMRGTPNVMRRAKGGTIDSMDDVE